MLFFENWAGERVKLITAVNVRLNEETKLLSDKTGLPLRT